jgi:hypothetical protein
VNHFTATITYDGSTSAGTVSGTGPFTVSGSHTFRPFSGTRTLTVVITDKGDGHTITVTAPVQDPPPDEAFVLRLYQDVLQRPADPAGLAFWKGLLAQGVARPQIVRAVEESLEYRILVVQDLYRQLLHRPADANGLAAFTHLLGSGSTLDQVRSLIAGSAEYFQSRGGGTNDGFLVALYQDGLNRTLDATGRSGFG